MWATTCVCFQSRRNDSLAVCDQTSGGIWRVVCICCIRKCDTGSSDELLRRDSQRCLQETVLAVLAVLAVLVIPPVIPRGWKQQFTALLPEVLLWLKPVSLACLSHSRVWKAPLCPSTVFLWFFFFLLTVRTNGNNCSLNSACTFFRSETWWGLDWSASSCADVDISFIIMCLPDVILFWFTQFIAGAVPHWHTSLLRPAAGVLMIANREGFQGAGGQQRIYFLLCFCCFQYHNDLILSLCFSLLQKPQSTHSRKCELQVFFSAFVCFLTMTDGSVNYKSLLFYCETKNCVMKQERCLQIHLGEVSVVM